MKKKGKLLELVEANLLKVGGFVYLGSDKSNKGKITATGCIRFSRKVLSSPTAFAHAVSIKQKRTSNANPASGWSRVRYKGHFLSHWREKLEELQKISNKQKEVPETSLDSRSRADHHPTDNRAPKRKGKADSDTNEVAQTKKGRKPTTENKQAAQNEASDCSRETDGLESLLGSELEQDLDVADSGTSDSHRETMADEAGHLFEEPALIEQLATSKSQLADSEQSLQAANLRFRQLEDEQRQQVESHHAMMAHYAISCYELHKQVADLKKKLKKQVEKTESWKDNFHNLFKDLKMLEDDVEDKDEEIANLKNEVARLEPWADDPFALFSGRDLQSIDEEMYKYFIGRYDSEAADILEANPDLDEEDWRSYCSLLEHDRFQVAASVRDAFKTVCKMHPDKTKDVPALERARLTAHFKILAPIIQTAKDNA